MATEALKKPLLLMILDGWGYREDEDHNAIALAPTPCWDNLWRDDPHLLLRTSGESVGLPEGQMGNSEVGHMNIGAGRIVYQELTRIDQSIRDGSFFENAQLCSAIDAAVAADRTVHVMGLLSPGGVHSHEDHFHATVKLAADRDARSIEVHAFLDGRDTPPRSAEASIRGMQELLDETPGARFSTVCGRYYAMDRDNRWDRVERAYRAITARDAECSSDSARAALHEAYERGEDDEFVQATTIGDGQPVRNGDAVIFINFRADRARELTRAFVSDEFDGFERPKIELAAYVCMTEYMADLPVSVAFPPQTLNRLLGEELSRHGMRQLRIAETEKYAHVTFFFNGGMETPFPLEDRLLIPSPTVATYDLQPEMSLPELTDRLIEAIHSGDYDVIICNVANPDMVGHTGKLDAAVRAVEAVDHSLARATEAIDQAGGELLITADHGNVEQMSDPTTGQSHTAHTSNPVPFVFHGRPARTAETGSLRDIAPTILSLLGLSQPAEMTGKSLLVTEEDAD
ncbi:MAG: 2,3-bisphosphoglycerate-independent phosphoglycerate mutase [Xanthomonadales bacterium]|nr:2,3-bisphosphoglycerate-independent phosphoglycerate mutase [Xanthomonadales bacterium]